MQDLVWPDIVMSTSLACSAVGKLVVIIVGHTVQVGAFPGPADADVGSVRGDQIVIIMMMMLQL